MVGVSTLQIRENTADIYISIFFYQVCMGPKANVERAVKLLANMHKNNPKLGNYIIKCEKNIRPSHYSKNAVAIGRFCETLFSHVKINTRTAYEVILTHFHFCSRFFYLNIKIRRPCFLTFRKNMHIYSIQIWKQKLFYFWCSEQLYLEKQMGHIDP